MFRHIAARVKAFLHRDRIDEELDDEVRFHVEMETTANLARGMTPTEARRVALRDLGGVTQTREAVRRVRAPWYDSVWQDVRFGVRTLARTPLFAASAILTLALGIGANTAIFSLINAVLFHPLPVSEPDRLVTLTRTYKNPRNLTSAGFLYEEFLAFREHSRSFTGVTAEGDRVIGLGDEDGTRQVSVKFVSADYFQVVGVQPRLGRWFLPQEEQPSAPPVVVLTDSAWRRWFDADPHVVGKLLRLTGVSATVVGVAPPAFRGTTLTQRPDVFVPVMAAPVVAAVKENFFSSEEVRTEDGQFWSPTSWLHVIGRLRPGVSREAAQSEMRLLAARLSPARAASAVLSLEPAAHSALPDYLRPRNVNLARLLGGIVGVVLLVGCAGLAGLLIAQTERRRRELATRLALGAPRRRILRQLLTETGLLVVAGAVGGLAVSRLMLAALASFALPGPMPIEDIEPRLDLTVLLFATGVALVTAILCGLLPAWRASYSIDVTASLKTLGRATGRGRSWLQPITLTVQVALTLILLVGASLFVRSIQAGFATDLGFRPERLVSVTLNPRLRRYDGQRSAMLVNELVDRLKAMPGVEAVGVGPEPFGGALLSGPSLGADGQRKRLQPYVSLYFVDVDYFRTLGIPLARGRTFAADDTATGTPVAVVNEALARGLWPDTNAVGRHVTNFPVSGPGIAKEVEVVGIVGNLKSLRPGEGAPILYVLRAQFPSFNAGETTLTVRVNGTPDDFAASLRRQVRSVDRDLPVTAITTMEEQIGKALMTQRLGAWLTGWFGVLALSLALVGTYGIVAYTVARKTSEIGLRIALGANPSRIPFVMLRSGLVPVVVGVALGVAGAWPSARLIKTFLYGVPPQDPIAFAGSALLLLAAAAAASYIAARRASRVDPIVALRAE